MGSGGPLEQARAHLAAGRLDEARAAAQRVLRNRPRDAEANDLMRAALVKAGQYEPALFFAQRAMEAAPDHAGVAADCGAVLGALGRHDQAIPILQRAVTLDPLCRQGHFALVASLLSLERLADAEEAARRGLEHLPGDTDLLLKQAAALLNLGLPDRASAIVAGLLFAHGDDRTVAEAAATISNYDPVMPRTRVFAAHKNIGRLIQHADLSPVYRHEARPARAPGERLRVGILSADLRQHSVGAFAEPIIEHLDRSRFDLFIYDTAARPDAVTERMRRYPSTWRRAAGLEAARLAAGIHADSLDILIELSGLTAGHSLEAVRLKPAPVIATYLGFPNTTGLPTVDYRLVDSATDPSAPEGDADAFAVERLVRLDPCFLCYRPPDGAPPAREERRAESGPVTFGCFNALAKVNDPLLVLWARVLAAAPGSRLLIKARELASDDVREHLRGRCVAAGIDPSRLEIAPPTPRPAVADHLAFYRRVDVALDTFPYHGTTTTCEALWMGVPVVTLVGTAHASRVGWSLLRAVGRPAWAAATEDEYVRVGADLALAASRAGAPGGPGLRAAMAGSPLCDAPGFARRFEAALESMVRGTSATGAKGE